MSGTRMTPVEGYGITSEQAAHEAGKVDLIAAKQDMKMVWDQSPGKTVGAGLNEKAAETVQEPLPVVIVQKDIGAFNTTNDDVLQ